MRFIGKKNFLEGEDLLYTPQLHWMFILKPLIMSLPFFIVLLIIFVLSSFDAFPSGFEMFQLFELDCSAQNLGEIIRYVLIGGLIIVALPGFLWRILLYLNTEYGITNKRLIMRKGIFRVYITEILTDRIESLYCVQGVLGRLLNYGTVYISGIGGIKTVFFMVDNPFFVRLKIVEVFEKNKTINKI